MTEHDGEEEVVRSQLRDLPTEVLDALAEQLSTRDRFALASTCRELWQHAQASHAYWRSLAVSATYTAQPRRFLAQAQPRRYLVKEVTLWEPFGGGGGARSSITAANLAMLQALGRGGDHHHEAAGSHDASRDGSGTASGCAALESLVWNVQPACSLLLTGLCFPNLRSLELDFMDTIDVVATLALPGSFGVGLPALTRLCVSNAAALRAPPGSLPPSLRSASFENVYSPVLISNLAAALATSGAKSSGAVPGEAPTRSASNSANGSWLQALHVRNMERRGVTLSLDGLLLPTLRHLTSLQLHHPYQPLDPSAHLSALTALRELDLGLANVSSSSLSSLGQLPGLTHIGLQGCALVEFPDELWALPQLQVLELGDNYLKGGIPGAAAAATALTRLSIDLKYAAEGGMQLGRLPGALRALELTWHTSDLPQRLLAALPWLRGLTQLGSLTLLPTAAAWPPPSPAPRDCPAVLSGLQELASSNTQLAVALSRY